MNANEPGELCCCAIIVNIRVFLALVDQVMDPSAIRDVFGSYYRKLWIDDGVKKAAYPSA